MKNQKNDARIATGLNRVGDPTISLSPALWNDFFSELAMIYASIRVIPEPERKELFDQYKALMSIFVYIDTFEEMFKQTRSCQ